MGKQKEENQAIPPSYIFDKLTPFVATDVLIKFLQGDLYGSSLRKVYYKFSLQVKRLNASDDDYRNILLYDGIRKIVKLAITNGKLTSNLLQVIKKITDYAKQNVNTSIDFLAPLFQNKYFRNLFSQALHLYWLSNSDALKEDDLKAFDGQESAKTLLKKLKEQLLQNRDRDNASDHTNKMVRYVRMLYKLEKDIQQPAGDTIAERAKGYRQKAYLILDWIPTLLATSAKSIISNTFIQAAVYLQQASAHEKVPYVSMSDQKVALRLYLTAVGMAHYITPDEKFYVLVQCLKYMANFKYDDPELAEIIPAFQRRALVIADIFPFFQANQSNIDFLQQEDKPVILMRQLLHAFIAMINDEKVRNEKSGAATKSAIDHSYVNVFYQVYEACLNNWYEKKYDPETEKNFRIKLMHELLAINRWTFFDLNFNLESPWLMIDRDTSGWMKQNRTLPFPAANMARNFSAINGLELNYKTGEMAFMFKQWKPGDASYNNVLSLLDLSELFQQNITCALFSLDPIDPDKRFHPFNKMRFAPNNLCLTQLFHTMLLTDYLLKFMTVGVEVQGRLPYNVRPIDHVTKHLPEYLKKIIDDFHASVQSESMHRFWIETEGVCVAEENAELDAKGVSRYALDDIKMVVRKNVLMQDIDGNLVDKEEEGEGWDLYVLTPQQKREVDTGRRIITGYAIIFILGTYNLHFVEGSLISSVFTLKYNDHHLRNLYKLTRDTNNKINGKGGPALRLIYLVAKEITRQSGKPHRFSSEYVFAQEFTDHYDEFAMYFPEFGRLRELSKAIALIRIMDNLRDANKEKIKEDTSRLKDVNFWQQRKAELSLEVKKVVDKNFLNWRSQFSTAVLAKECSAALDAMKSQIGTLVYTVDSAEVTASCQRLHDEIMDKHGYSVWSQQSSRIWSEVIDPDKARIAADLTTSKFDSCLSQLKAVFKDQLTSLSNIASEEAIKGFLNGNKTALLSALVADDESKIQKQIQAFYPLQSCPKIGAALNGSAAVLDDIIQQEAVKIINENKEARRVTLAGHERLEASFKKLGLGSLKVDVKVDDICFWVPASIRHEVLTQRSRVVYGGVHISPAVSFFPAGNGVAPLLVN